MSIQMWLNNPQDAQLAAAPQIATDTFYVSPFGSGVGGATWATAFTTIAAAIAACSAVAGHYNVVYIATGTYDLNSAGYVAIAKNIRFIGVGPNVLITNQNAAPVGLFNITGHCYFENIVFYTTNAAAVCNGVTITAAGGNATVFKECVFYAVGAFAGAATLINIVAAADTCKILNCVFLGLVGQTTGIITASSFTVIQGNQFFTCLLGVSITPAASNDNIIKGCEFIQCATGLNIIVAALRNMVIDTKFIACPARVTDGAISTHYMNVESDIVVAEMYPLLTANVVVTGGAANVYTAAPGTDIIAAAAVTQPFRVTNLQCQIPGDIAEPYTILFNAIENGVTIPIGAIRGIMIATGCINVPVRTRFFGEGTNITARVKTNGGADTIPCGVCIEQL